MKPTEAASSPEPTDIPPLPLYLALMVKSFRVRIRIENGSLGHVHTLRVRNKVRVGVREMVGVRYVCGTIDDHGVGVRTIC